tara:strand:+ start:738 stop:1091 length:354 start_codon:yes stop_codon:yes gene_type:complete
MDNLYYKVKLYLEDNSKSVDEFKKLPKTISLEDHNDGQGARITFWNVDGLIKPTDAQLNALSSQAAALENNAKIDEKRRTEYLPFEDQLEMIYKDQKNGTSTYKDHCDKVRSDNPKE